MLTGTYDVEMIDLGSIVQFIPETENGVEWLDSNTDAEDFAWTETALLIEPRLACDIIDRMLADGIRCHASRLN